MSKNREQTRFEAELVGRRVQIRSFDWQRTLSGKLEKVERYAYVLRLDAGGSLFILKHACSAIAPLAEEKP